MSLKMLCFLKKIILYFLSVVIFCLKLVHRHLLFCAVQSVFLHRNVYPWWLIRTYLQNMFDLGQTYLLYIRWGEVWSKWLFGYASLPVMLRRTESESVAITETFKFSKFPINKAFWIHECFLMQNKPFIWISSVLIPHSCGSSPGPCSKHYQLERASQSRKYISASISLMKCIWDKLFDSIQLCLGTSEIFVSISSWSTSSAMCESWSWHTTANHMLLNQCFSPHFGRYKEWVSQMWLPPVIAGSSLKVWVILQGWSCIVTKISPRIVLLLCWLSQHYGKQLLCFPYILWLQASKRLASVFHFVCIYSLCGSKNKVVLLKLVWTYLKN